MHVSWVFGDGMAIREIACGVKASYCLQLYSCLIVIWFVLNKFEAPLPFFFYIYDDEPTH